MVDLNQLCQGLVNNVYDALGAAVVDLESGLLLGVAHNIPYFTQSYLDTVAAAAVDMFRGNTVNTVEKLLSQQRDAQNRHLVKEIQMSTDKILHFMSIVPGKPNALLLLITGRKTNLGMGWGAVRMATSEAAPLCP
jgi:hypothetical protein